MWEKISLNLTWQSWNIEAKCPEIPMCHILEIHYLQWMINVDPTDASKIKVLIHSQFLLIILLKIPISFTFGKFSQSRFGGMLTGLFCQTPSLQVVCFWFWLWIKSLSRHITNLVHREKWAGSFFYIHIILFPF